eukprot:TRINITY_DN28161_c0_g1_i1.p1 TRINITY_DN28161_c0_g1~~TRINITY_DN28161_c0_g1_i1.p1  ORF type:complete len:133 (-),score=5.35 TRINITY_DN28161_c0_g1_i1:3-401(-)
MVDDAIPRFDNMLVQFHHTPPIRLPTNNGTQHRLRLPLRGGTALMGLHGSIAIVQHRSKVPGIGGRASKIPGSVRELSLIHISEPTRLLSISYAVFCLKKKKRQYMQRQITEEQIAYQLDNIMRKIKRSRIN